MKRNTFTFFSLLIVVFAILVIAYAQDPVKDKLIPYKFLTTVEIPGDLASFDISWVDSEASRYYLADRGDASATPPRLPGIDVIDTKHAKFVFNIPGLAVKDGGFVSPNGVVAVPGASDGKSGKHSPGELWIGDGDSTAKVIDLDEPFAVPIAISTGGNHRADELAFDPVDQIILIANDQDTPSPFVTFISTASHKILGKIIYDGTMGNPQTTGGIEQPVWDGAKQLFYIAIPATTAHPKGEVDEINPQTMKITREFPTSCGPAGLALIPEQRLMTSCGDVLDIATGNVVHTVTPTVGADEIWFNSGDERVYFGGGTAPRIHVPVVDALSPYEVITTLTVGTTSVTPNHTTHSVAADSLLNRIFVPVTHEGVKVYTDDQDNGFGPKD